ncbi:hypothetical protein K435DRAFT_799463 [Dendrothele bispora CBS 962.96]|uniref:DUF6589 domain-containing protein n=1 Tax=Dendrothele bispora (strain CBS 962.96) TaxID=1314807 RepID=A0A4S8LWE9_DENBC|nr:hypothetical protein K435DRAFT_799463 [Dendrothele bispora CBS 962.96]
MRQHTDPICQYAKHNTQHANTQNTQHANIDTQIRHATRNHVTQKSGSHASSRVFGIASRMNSVLITRKHRPPSIIQDAAISSFVLARNQYAKGYLAVQFGIWHIACQSHVDVKCISCLMGARIHDASARHVLATIADDSLSRLRLEVKGGHEKCTVLYRYVLDNIQQFLKVWEGGIGHENRLICGCAGTAIGMDDIAPGAFNLEDLFSRILRNDQSELTVKKIYNNIHWNHISAIQELHVLRVLLRFVPSLNSLEKQVTEYFRTTYAIHRMCEGWKTKLVPLGTNSEHEIETEGMKCAIHDFLSQSDWQPEYSSKLIQKTIWETEVLDCWRLEIGLDHPEDIIRHFKNLGKQDQLPEYEVLLQNAKNITERYITLESYEQALSPNDSDSSLIPDCHKFPIGTLFESRNSVGRHNSENDVSINTTHTFTEGEDFTGDHVLANSVLFMWEYSLWVQLD